jgi:uncharacterized lipoprotein YmbA
MTRLEAMLRSGHLYAAACAAVLLTACATSPAVRFYHLEPMDLDFAQDGSEAIVLAFGPISFPDYLERPQIVRRSSGAQLLVDEFNRWAEPLDEAVPRIIAMNVDGLMDDLIVVPFRGAAVDAAFRLFGSVKQFDADQTGRAVLVVQWGITRKDGELIVPPRTSRYQLQAARPDDPDAIAQAMTQVLETFSRDIVTMIRAAW